MKQCNQCGSKYADDIQSCPNCNLMLGNYNSEKEIKEENDNFIQTVYKKANILIHNLTLYHAIIIYIVLIFFVVISYFFGTLRKYDDNYITDKFNMVQNNFEELTSAYERKEAEETNKNNLGIEITGIKAQIDAVNDFAENQDSYNAEIENMRIETENLSKQVEDLEAQLNDISSQLSD